MDTVFLQKILKAELFKIGDADNRLDWLKSSISDLEKKLNDDNSLIPTYTLVALDPNISDSEPVLVETEKLIIEYWEALRIRYTEMPSSIIRGVMLNALYNTGLKNPKNARIIYLTATNYFPYAKLGLEKELVEEMLIELGEIAENEAIEEWSLTEEEPKLRIGTLKSGAINFDKINFDKNKFQEKWDEAFTNSPSGHGPQHGFQNNQYRDHFNSKTSDAISSSINNAFANFSKTLSSVDIETPINKFFTNFKKSLDTALKESFSSITAVERRSKLLWWKETLYSQSLNTSYRNLDKNTLPIVMANDLYEQVPEITPVSVDYLLRDTLFLLNDKKDDPLTFEVYLSSIAKDELKHLLKPYVEDVTNYEGRITITDFISLLLNDEVELTQFNEKTGIDKKEEISYTDLSASIFHDLLTQYLIR